MPTGDLPLQYHCYPGPVLICYPRVSDPNTCTSNGMVGPEDEDMQLHAAAVDCPGRAGRALLVLVPAVYHDASRGERAQGSQTDRERGRERETEREKRRERNGERETEREGDRQRTTHTR